MSNSIYSFLLFKALYAPKAAFARLVSEDHAPLRILLRYSLWLLLLPPLFSFVGASQFGWRLGATEPLFMAKEALALISIGYFCILFFGLVTTALISRWMADTYVVNVSFGRHVALITIFARRLQRASTLVVLDAPGRNGFLFSLFNALSGAWVFRGLAKLVTG